jgi:hypothetical protein
MGNTRKLYHHPIGDEMGMVHLVITDPEDPEGVRLVLSSEKGRDLGVVFTVDIDSEDYEGMCEDFKVDTLEGCILATSGNDIEIREVPEDPPTKRPEKAVRQGNVAFMRTPQLWKHAWGRCCCVKRGGMVEPVTPERIAAGEVPWWDSIYTPFELDLATAGNDIENPHQMHLLIDHENDSTICGVCDHYTWVAQGEDVPDELPPHTEDEEVDEPLLPVREALAGVEWASKGEAWQLFMDDPHNRAIIESSGLPSERASQQRRFSTEKAFTKVNRQSSENFYTIKQVFYAALGNTRSGTWAEFNLDLVRLVKGLQKVDVPTEVLEQVELEDTEANAALHQAAGQRAARAAIDDDATVLEGMLDEAAGFDPEDEDEDEKPIEKLRTVQRTDGQPAPQRISLLTAAEKLRDALNIFIAAVKDEKATKASR